MAQNPGKYMLMGEDPRLPKMPDKPTLIDYFRCRFASTSHLLQSATHALKAGHNEKVVLACLLHDIAVVSFIRCDHGYWGAQMIEPYVDEEVSWAVKAHQALRFFPDESVGYKYPEMYVKLFGPDYQPEPYIVAEYERARNHKHYMTSRLITRERHLLVRSQRQGQPRRLHRHHRPQFQAAEGRPRPRQQPVGAHVAHHAVAEPVPVDALPAAFVGWVEPLRDPTRCLPNVRVSRSARPNLRTCHRSRCTALSCQRRSMRCDRPASTK